MKLTNHPKYIINDRMAEKKEQSYQYNSGRPDLTQYCGISSMEFVWFSQDNHSTKTNIFEFQQD